MQEIFMSETAKLATVVLPGTTFLDKDIKIEEKIQITFEKIKTHPFLIENPIQSKEIAFFRIKLLGLS